jgi:hypothetical protein
LLDPHFDRIDSTGKRAAWFMDQYCHPHETVHSIGEVLQWMNVDGFEFVNSLPHAGLDADDGDGRLFSVHSSGTAVTRAMNQLRDMGSGYREGGFFVVIGRRVRGAAT